MPKNKPAVKKAAKKPAMKKTAPNRVKPIPEGYHVVTAYLCVDGASAAMDFYARVFGARTRMRMEAPGGKIGHAELKIGDSVLMLADEHPEMDFKSPKSRGGSSVTIHVYVKDVDKVVAGAVAAGAKLVRPAADMFYGDRNAMVEDPWGHMWSIATHIEDVSPAQMKKRMAQVMGQKQG